MRIDTPWQRFVAWLHLNFVDHGIVRLLFNNFYQVLPQVYRSSQPSIAQIKRYHQQYGIKTIINLRGKNDTMSFWLFEKEICDQLGIKLIDHRLKSRALPTKEVINDTQALLNEIEYPVLFHCKSGADRAGLMATLSQIFIGKQTVAQAIDELDWYYGHFKFAKTGKIDFFFAAYLDYQRQTEQPLSFIDWVNQIYDEQAVDAAFRSSWWGNLLTDTLLRRE